MGAEFSAEHRVTVDPARRNHSAGIRESKGCDTNPDSRRLLLSEIILEKDNFVGCHWTVAGCKGISSHCCLFSQDAPSES